MKIVLIISCYFFKKIPVCLGPKNLIKLMKVNIKTIFNYQQFLTIIPRQLKHHQHGIRSEIDISLEIILIFFKFLTVSIVSIKSLLQQQHKFSLLQLESSVNFLCCQMCKFYYLLRKKRCTIIPDEKDVCIWQDFIESFVYHYIMPGKHI